MESVHLPWPSRTWWFRQRAGFLVAGFEDRWTLTLNMGELWPWGGVYSMLSGREGGVMPPAAAAIIGTSLDLACSGGAGWCSGLTVPPPIGVSTIIRLFNLDLGFEEMVVGLVISAGGAPAVVLEAVVVLVLVLATVVLEVAVLLVLASVLNLIGLTVNALSS